MVEVDFENISEEDLNYFVDHYIEIFEEVQKSALLAYEERKPYLDEVGTISNLNVTPKGKLLFLARKLVKNVLISRFTGIEPMYLDSDTSSISSERKRREFYEKCDMRILIKNVYKVLIPALEHFLTDLKSENNFEVKKNIVSQINTCYLKMYSWSYDKTAVHDIIISYLLKSCGYMTEDQLLQHVVIGKRGIALEFVKEDIIQEVKNVYEEYDIKRNSKGR